MTSSTAIGFLNYAREYLAAAQHLRTNCSTKMAFQFQPPLPSFYCLGHGIELMLKAYLLQQGVAYTELKKQKKLGHDIKRLFVRARLENLPKLSSNVQAIPTVIEKLQHINGQDYLLRYRPENGNFTHFLDSSDWNELENFAIEHYNHIALLIAGSTNFRQLTKCKSPEVDALGLTQLAEYLGTQ
jgi:hypothetical protein